MPWRTPPWAELRRERRHVLIIARPEVYLPEGAFLPAGAVSPAVYLMAGPVRAAPVAAASPTCTVVVAHNAEAAVELLPPHPRRLRRRPPRPAHQCQQTCLRGLITASMPTNMLTR
eukprot:1180709-Prorocentrum_minimum.AAC.1